MGLYGAIVSQFKSPLTGPAASPNVPVAEVRAQLERILASRFFARSDRLSRFLKFSVEHALAGTCHHVKEQIVGVEVFDRKTSYDPRIDPIVRVEARRLRARLKEYYASDGQAEVFTIEFPKGGYAPVFRASLTADGAPTKLAVAPERPSEISIAVLPFVNLTPQAAEDYFTDGLTEELIHLLTAVRELRVVSWHSASRLRGREQDLDAIREQLKVGVFLRGSLRRTTDRVRVTVQLIDLESGAYLWSEMYDRTMQDVFAMQEEMAQSIVTTLQLALHSPGGPGRRSAKPTFECYTLCLQGRFHANRRTMEGLEKSVACYRQATLADPNSAMAYTGLADAYSLLADYGAIPPEDGMPKARAAAQRALDLDPGSGEALVALAFVRSLYDWEWDDAQAQFQRAIALNPGNARAHHWFGIDFLARLGRFDEAAAEIDTARRLDPLSQITHEGAGAVRMLMRDYEASLQIYRELLDLDPTFYKFYSSIARVLSLMGRYTEAIAMFEKALMLAGDLPNLLGALGQTLALAGRRPEAIAKLAALTRLTERKSTSLVSLAILHLGLGENEQALQWLEKACDRKEAGISWIKVHPLYDPLRGDPRFETLLKRVRLA